MNSNLSAFDPPVWQKPGQARLITVRFPDESTLVVQYPDEMELIETAEDFIGRRKVDPPASHPNATPMQAWTWDQERRKAVREDQYGGPSSSHVRDVNDQRNDLPSSSVGIQALTQRLTSRHHDQTQSSVQGTDAQLGAVSGPSYPAYPQGSGVESRPYGGQMHAQSFNPQPGGVPAQLHPAYPQDRTVDPTQYFANQSPYAPWTPTSGQPQPAYPLGVPSQTYSVQGTTQSAYNQWGAAPGTGYPAYSQDQRQSYSQMSAQVPNTQWGTVPYTMPANRGRGPTAPPDRQTAADFYATNPGIPYSYATQSSNAIPPGYGGNYDNSAAASRRGNGYWDANGYYHEQSDNRYDGKSTHE